MVTVLEPPPFHLLSDTTRGFLLPVLFAFCWVMLVAFMHKPR